MKPASVSIQILLAGGVLALAACVSVPAPPSDALQSADIALANAENEHAAEAAPLEMRSAHDKLAAAHGDAQQADGKRMTQARRQADEARADAELASAKARLARTEAVNQELQKSSNSLRQEIQRGPGV
ncbi:DUF4398 domain-containing protein [Solimonas aquatica]|nr:DUF4398 domain-containing protein [Solimonas aquatica]